VNGVVVFLIIGGGIAALWLIQTAIGKSVSAVDRTVRKKTHAAGRAEVAAALSFSAPVPPGALVTEIVSTVNAHPSPPALVPGLYLKHDTASMAQFAFGSRTHGDLFGAVVRLKENTSGCTGTYEILHWTESGADVSGKTEMTKMRARIADAVRAVSGEVQPA
jgi:hypothetical protein